MTAHSISCQKFTEKWIEKNGWTSKTEDISKYKFPFNGPIGYTLYSTSKAEDGKTRDVYYIHNFEVDDMVIGSGLPVGETLAIEYCRMGHICWNQGRSFIQNKILEDVFKIKQRTF